MIEDDIRAHIVHRSPSLEDVRSRNGFWALALDAADEITRLRAEVKRMRDAETIDDWPDWMRSASRLEGTDSVET